ncbi:MAG: OB-fold nucleic acid binding domain-containing protein [Spirochaetaceae bacterium]
MTLEDETGFVNLVIWQKVYDRFRTTLLTCPVLGVRGRLQKQEGVVHLVVQEAEDPGLRHRPTEVKSRDFQ